MDEMPAGRIGVPSLSQAVDIDRVVVGWDGSVPARAALEWAIARQQSAGGAIELVHVVEATALAVGPLLQLVEDSARIAATAMNDEVVHCRLRAPEIEWSGAVVVGNPVGELLRRSGPASIIAVGSHVRSATAARLGWSFGARLLSGALGPVAVIPPRGDGEGHGVVVGVNGSDESIAAALFAAREAAARGAELHAVFAWQEPVAEELNRLNPHFSAWVRDSNATVFAAALEPVRSAFPELSVVTHLDNDTPSAAILRHARGRALVVVGSRGHGFVRRFLLGSVSHSVLVALEIPTIVMGHAASVRRPHRAAAGERSTTSAGI